MKIINAKSPVWNDASQTKISLLVDFEEFEGDTETPFLAEPNDTQEYGVELFNRAAAGEFGPIGAYVPPAVLIHTIDEVIKVKTIDISTDRLAKIALARGTTAGNLTDYEAKISRLTAVAQIVKYNPTSFTGVLFNGKALPNSSAAKTTLLTTFLTEQVLISAQIEQIILDYDEIMIRLANVSSTAEAEAFTW